jgi:ankyrin repeat protein
VLEFKRILVNLSREDSKTALFLAVKKDNLDVLKRLGKANAEIDCMDKKFRTPLSHAAERGFHKTMKFLVEKGRLISIRKIATNLLHYNRRSVVDIPILYDT